MLRNILAVKISWKIASKFKQIITKKQNTPKIFIYINISFQAFYLVKAKIKKSAKSQSVHVEKSMFAHNTLNFSAFSFVSFFYFSH